MSKVDVTYKVVERGTTNAPQNDPVLVDKNNIEVNVSHPAIFNKTGVKKVDHFRIKFEIKNFGSSRLRFAPNASDVLWVKKGGGAGNCPTTACHDLANEIWVDEIHSEGKRIEVINMDLEPTEFWFTLNLVDKNHVSGPFVPVDPPGDNQNGGGAGSRLTFSSVGLLTCAAVGLVVSIGAASLAGTPLDTPSALTFGIGGALTGLILGFIGFALARD